MKKTFFIFLFFAAIFLSAGCSFGRQPIENKPASDIIKANNKFAIDLYNKYKDKEENLFFSPYSISSALAMTYEGARGQTVSEIKSVFYFPEDQNKMRNSYLSLYRQINSKDKKYELRTANALWAEKEYGFLPSYFEVIEDYYGGKVNNLDFKTQAEKSRITINNWVEDQTNEKIKDLLPQGSISDLTRLVLTNAIYFKASWLKEFNKKDTSDMNFKTGQGNSVQAPTMKSLGEKSEFKYTEDKDVQVLEMPYSGEELSMLVLLPKGDNISKLEKKLNIDQLETWRSDLIKQRVKVYFPKFKFETKYFLVKDLQQMGMTSAFIASQADFSGMSGDKSLYISKVIHQAFVDVNEEGTESAAATAVVAQLGTAETGPQIPIFRADHPFVFLIQQNDTGNILFMGKVNNPVE